MRTRVNAGSRLFAADSDRPNIATPGAGFSGAGEVDCDDCDCDEREPSASVFGGLATLTSTDGINGETARCELGLTSAVGGDDGVVGDAPSASGKRKRDIPSGEKSGFEISRLGAPRFETGERVAPVTSVLVWFAKDAGGTKQSPSPATASRSGASSCAPIPSRASVLSSSTGSATGSRSARITRGVSVSFKTAAGAETVTLRAP
mmetsp:Transcript_13367/g.44277  ORF Transcript_13367/g.44277 Transcript_13367/m.44277 type:complete len:205 (+) Transcript_13367:1617-2231(+)